MAGISPDAEHGAVALGARLDLTAATGLHRALVERLGRPVRVDAGQVTHLGGLCLQTLLAAAAEARRAGTGFAVTPRSAAFDAACATFAITPADLEGAPPK